METKTEETQDELVATTPEALRQQAIRRVKKRRDFYAHLVVYLLFNAVIWGIWGVIAATSHSDWPWPVFVTLGWGIGLAMNAWEVFVRKPITEEEVQREMEHLRGSADGSSRAA